MSLTFGALTSDRVNLGSGTSIDNLNPFTWFMWIKPTTITANRVLCCKGLTGTNQKFLNISDASGNLSVTVARTSNTVYTSNSGPLSAAGTWYCVAVVFDSTAGAGNLIHIYTGTLTSILAEVTYGTKTAGSGSVTADASSNFFWGNRSNFDAALQGDFAIGMIFNRALSLGELKEQQFNPTSVSGCVAYNILGWNGTGSQPDWSGNGNPGTVIGATTSTHVPLGSPFGHALAWPGSFTAAATGIVYPQLERFGHRGAFRGMLH